MNKTILLFAVLAFASMASATNLEAYRTLWSTWKVQHGKTYLATEELTRFGIFVENVIKIAKMNAENTGVKFSINNFADLTATEFALKYANGGLPSGIAAGQKNLRRSFGDLPESVDWREKGAVTPVKNQGSCGSCWTFSTTGVLEGFYFINHGELISFSEQQIVDCADDAGFGCQGGWPEKAIEYACKFGLEKESDYPYNARDGQCHYDASKAIKVCNGYELVTPKSTDALKTALVEKPVAVAVEADQRIFQFYSSGVVSAGCGAELNHAVLAVGYQKVGALEAFIVKNSWGKSWGSEGYIHISTIQQLNNGQGACGILAEPVIPN